MSEIISDITTLKPWENDVTVENQSFKPIPSVQDVLSHPLIKNVFSDETIGYFEAATSSALGAVALKEDGGMSGVEIDSRENFRQSIEFQWLDEVEQMSHGGLDPSKLQNQMILFDTWLSICDQTTIKPHPYILRTQDAVRNKTQSDGLFATQLSEFERMISAVLSVCPIWEADDQNLSNDQMLSFIDTMWSERYEGTNESISGLYSEWRRLYLELTEEANIEDFPQIVAFEMTNKTIEYLKKVKKRVEMRIKNRYQSGQLDKAHTVLFGDVESASTTNYLDGNNNVSDRIIFLNTGFISQLRDKFNPDIVYYNLGLVHDAVFNGLIKYQSSQEYKATLADSIYSSWCELAKAFPARYPTDERIIKYTVDFINQESIGSKYLKANSMHKATQELKKARELISTDESIEKLETASVEVLKKWGLTEAQIAHITENPDLFDNFFSSLLHYGPFLLVRQSGLPVWAAAGLVANMPGIRPLIKDHDMLAMSTAIATLVSSMLVRGRSNYKSLLENGMTPDLIAQTGFLTSQLVASHPQHKHSAKVGAFTGEMASLWYVINPATLIPITALDYPIGFVTYAASVAYNYLLEGGLLIPEKNRGKIFNLASKTMNKIKPSQDEDRGRIG